MHLNPNISIVILIKNSMPVKDRDTVTLGDFNTLLWIIKSVDGKNARVKP